MAGVPIMVLESFLVKTNLFPSPIDRFLDRDDFLIIVLGVVGISKSLK